MASNRFNAKKRAPAASVSAQTPKHELAALARHTAHVQVAALTAAGGVISGWAQEADRFAQAVGDELLRRIDGDTDSRELIVRIAAATNVHLRELTALPSAATNHFNTRLARVSTDN
jgi:hypothetical protein